jgi:hypothetical protein
MRARIRAVMRYAGPRMLFRHPVLAFFHLLDRRRGAPQLPLAEGAKDSKLCEPQGAAANRFTVTQESA